MSQYSISGFKIPLPKFCLDKDQDEFYPWRSTWLVYLNFYGFNAIADPGERKRLVLNQLRCAMSEYTWNWVRRQGFTKEEGEDSEFLIEAFEAHIKGSNPLIQRMELIQLKQGAEECIHSFLGRVVYKELLCDLDKIENFPDYFKMLCLIKGQNSTELYLELISAQVDTFEKAANMCRMWYKAKERSKLFSKQSVSESPADVNAATRHKKDRRPAKKGGQDRGGY